NRTTTQRIPRLARARAASAGMTRPLPLLAGIALALTGCGSMVEASAPVTSPAGGTATAGPASTPTTTATLTLPGAQRVPAAPAAVTRRLNRITGIAGRQYTRETSGVVVHADLRQIAGDAGLRAAARSGNQATLRAYVQGRFPAWYHLHVSRLQILRG